MNWTDEFEMTFGDAQVYIEVEITDGSVQNFIARDEMGELLDEDYDNYDEIKDEVQNREYEHTDFSSTFEFYDQQLDHFDKDPFSLKDV